MTRFNLQTRFNSTSLVAGVTATLIAGLVSSTAFAVEPAAPWQSLGEIVKDAPKSDWRAIPPENTLYLELPTGRVVIELAPAFAPLHVANIKTLVEDKYFDGLAVIRSQDNYVMQWGDRDEVKPIGRAKKSLPSETERPFGADLPFSLLPDRDAYAPVVGFSGGFPAARDGQNIWLAHCYGMVGVGRGNAAESANGTQLYVVNGHAPRHLDRNVPLVGRVVQGMELLSVIPRGTGPLGFYEKGEQRMPVNAMRLASDLPPAQRTRLEAMRTDSASFARVVESRRNCRSEWCKAAAAQVELCNVQLPIRVIKD